MEKAYTLRPLEGDDIFVMLQIINKIGISEVKGLLSSSNVKDAVSEALQKGELSDDIAGAIGVQVILDLVCLVTSRIPDCKGEIYNFLSSLSGMTVEEVAHLDILVFTEMIEDVIKKQEFKHFFTVALRLLKQAI